MTAMAHNTDELDSTFLTWRIVADELAAELPKLILNYEDNLAMQKYEYLKEDDAESNLIAHARRELELGNWFEEDQDMKDWAESLVAAVAEFTHYGHSGGSALFAINMLHKLVQFHPLGPLTSNPKEWQDVTEYMDGAQLWQNLRDSRMFSYDKGQTWYSVEDPRWHQRFRGYFFRRKWNKIRNGIKEGTLDNH